MKIFSDVSLEYMHEMGKADCQVESDKEENRGKKVFRGSLAPF